MTDKEKIDIDGVDVSGCSVYKNGLCLVTKNKCNARCDYASYYLYEQLARKTAECEELKKEKAEIKKYLGIDSKTILERLEELQERRDELSEKNISYEQALDTVSEYIKDNCYSCQGIKYGGCEKCELKRIKDIISKAKGSK